MNLISFKNNLYLASYGVSGESGKLYKSTNGKDFKEISAIKEGVMSLVLYNDTLYVGTIGIKNKVTVGNLYQSTDGDTFNMIRKTEGGIHALTTFKNNLYVGSWETTGSNNTGKLYKIY
ncbi:hypothetical protein [Spiroplasma endosymbiont of Nebria brevicollis]|uniref:hypothetical protein n=1 Tax=Spiroplasma endosymbiont of Nebria brevicollis TaxID=3066284 RepID=UPI00313EAEA7